MTRYRIADFNDLVHTYGRAVEEHLTRPASDPETSPEQATFDSSWFRSAAAHMPPVTPMTMERCEEQEQPAPDDSNPI